MTRNLGEEAECARDRGEKGNIVNGGGLGGLTISGVSSRASRASKIAGSHRVSGLGEPVFGTRVKWFGVWGCWIALWLLAGSAMSSASAGSISSVDPDRSGGSCGSNDLIRSVKRGVPEREGSLLRGRGEVRREVRGKVRRPHPSWLWLGAWEAWCWVDTGQFPERGSCPRAPTGGGHEGGRPCAFFLGGGGGLPSFGEVAAYLEDALGQPALLKGRDQLGFEREETVGWGVSWRRALLSRGSGWVHLQWFANDDFGMSELREFFEAPFFLQSESECFYRWLGSGGWHEGQFRGQPVRMGTVGMREFYYVEISWRMGNPSVERDRALGGGSSRILWRARFPAISIDRFERPANAPSG